MTIHTFNKFRRMSVVSERPSDSVREKDSLYYIVGCIITFGTAFIIGKSPSKYYFYWVALVQMFLIARRYIEYRPKQWHYFFTEF